MCLNKSGERAASALENYLTNLEQKIEELLAAIEEAEGNNGVSSKPNGYSDARNPTAYVRQSEVQLHEKSSNTRSR